MSTSQDFVNWICSKDLNYLYLKYILLCENNSLLGFASGTTHQTIYYPEVKAFFVCLPPPKEQEAITSVLGALDDKIELNRRMSETLEETAKAIFKSWFINFDPLLAKAAGRDPGLPRHIADLFPDAFEPSELGEIPTGWNVREIGQVVDIVGGTTPSTKEASFWENGVHSFATPKDLSHLRVPVVLDTERHITDAGLAQIGAGLLPRGTVLLSSRAPIGYIAITDVPLAINQGFIAMRPSTVLPDVFLLPWLRTAMREIVAQANGSTFLEISKSNFRSIPLVIPPPRMMSAFVSVVSPLYRRLTASERESQILAELRDTLLPKLVSGELRIRDAERFIEEVV